MSDRLTSNPIHFEKGKDKSFFHFFCQLISYLFHPLILTTYIVAIVLFLYPYSTIPNATIKLYLIIVVFVLTFLIPVVALITMYKMRIINNLYLENNRQRRIPYLITTIIYLNSYFFFKYEFNFNDDVLSSTLLIITFSMFMVAIISFFWKISAHSVGVGGLVGLTFWIHFTTQFNFLFLICASIAISGFTMTARLFLKSHTNAQVYAGFLLGLFVSLFGYPFLID